MKKIIILALMFSMGQSSWAQIREFQTTRLASTAGAGVASILSTEAALLNPAASAFFTGSSFSYQSYSTALKHENDSRISSSDDFSGRNTSRGLFVSDHDGPLKGGFAYLTQDENNFERKQIIAHSAAAVGEQTSMGLTYRYIQDVLPEKFPHSHRIAHQVSIGFAHILDENTILGLVINDPYKSTPGEERILAGLQYAFASRFTLIADIGSQFTKDVKEKHIWRAAIQLQLFDDFFFRVGQFYDNVRGTKGTGWGVGWIGPRLGVEFAQKISDQFVRQGYIYRDESLVDTSLSAIIKF
jgi:hypothetical protein